MAEANFGISRIECDSLATEAVKKAGKHCKTEINFQGKKKDINNIAATNKKY